MPGLQDSGRPRGGCFGSWWSALGVSETAPAVARGGRWEVVGRSRSGGRKLWKGEKRRGDRGEKNYGHKDEGDAERHTSELKLPELDIWRRKGDRPNQLKLSKKKDFLLARQPNDPSLETPSE
ncbi:hypothetical protein K438DRAFT_1762581 [Mycena galopus ATCC 62051]|nr:hypothetical protein K438DRAFT_1762581 [Mycena galopus ATCC 62051]